MNILLATLTLFSSLPKILGEKSIILITTVQEINFKLGLLARNPNFLSRISNKL